MNLAGLQSEIGRLLNDPANQRWGADILTTRINLAQTEVMGYTDALKTDESLTPTANVSAVILNANTLDIWEVVITRTNGDQFPLEGMDIFDLDFTYPDWRNWDPGEPKTWYYKGSDQTLNLVPAPDSNAAFASALTVTEIRKPADISVPADIPFDSNNQLVPYHMAIVHWVVAQCWLDDGTPEALAKSQFHRSGMISKPGEYEKQIMRINSQFDSPYVPRNIKYQKQGGRLGGVYVYSKSNPLGTW
jgi:hypothetical protein